MGYSDGDLTGGVLRTSRLCTDKYTPVQNQPQRYITDHTSCASRISHLKPPHYTTLTALSPSPPPPPPPPTSTAAQRAYENVGSRTESGASLLASYDHRPRRRSRGPLKEIDINLI